MQRLNRERLNIDGDSWILKLAEPRATAILVFVHGTFGDATDSWGETPRSFIDVPALQLFDVGSFGYTSKVFDMREPSVFSEKLRLWCNTHLQDYSDVYIVAHSMGGLLVRYSLCTMLRAALENEGIRKIRSCFLVASPVSGSTAAKLISRIPFASKLHKRLDFLKDPKVGGVPMGKAYADAAKAFVDSGGSEIDVPRFHIFAAESDKLVKAPLAHFYTDFDTNQGVVPGDHAKSKLDIDINSTLMQRIAQLVLASANATKTTQVTRIKAVQESTQERERAALSTSRSSPRAGIAAADAIDILLISCSNTKSDAPGAPYASAEGAIVDQLNEQDLRQLIFETRNRVLVNIQKGLIDGIEFQEGNRIEKPANKLLKFGPDIGGLLDDRIYLPAYQRYRGRCYQATQEEWRAFLQVPRHPDVLIMSGLYGLILATDPIQNYDVHLTDVDRGSRFNIQTYWKDRELMTEILISHIEWVEKNRGPVGRIFDCLSELSYQETINWSLIEHRWPALHRVFEHQAGRYALGNLGVWVRNVIQDPALLKRTEVDRYYTDPGFVTPVEFQTPERIAFEPVIGLSQLKAMRQITA